MKTLAIIGSQGMLGSDLVEHFSKRYRVTGINRNNYHDLVEKGFDVLINANGNSKRFWANQNPVDDFFASTVSVVKSVFDFPCGSYIYISSPDVYPNHSYPRFTNEEVQILPEKLDSYGLNKYLAEQVIKKYKSQEKFFILRASMILGSNLKKGPIFDVINKNKVFITLDSKLQMITTFAIAEVIQILLTKSITNQVLNVGGVGTVSLSTIEKILHTKISVLPNAQKQRYEMDVEKLRRWYPHLKLSQDYLSDFLTNRIQKDVS